MIRTDTPSLASHRASARPVGPAPMMRTSGLKRGSPRANLEGAVAEEAPRMPARLAVVLDRDFPVHQHEAVAARALDAPPLAAREVVRYLGGEAVETREVVDHEVRGRALGERATVAEAGAVCG